MAGDGGGVRFSDNLLAHNGREWEEELVGYND